MSKKSPAKRIELKNISPLTKQKLLAEKIYSNVSRSPKKNILRLPFSMRPVAASHFLKRPQKTPKSNEPSLLPTQHSATPKGLDQKQRRGLSLSSQQMKNLANVGHLRKFSVNPLQNVISAFATVSQTGYIPDFPQKENQDAYLEINDPELSIFAVFDGHGVNGGEVSNYLKNRIPFLLSKHLKDLSLSLKSIVLTADQELTKLIDISFSGSTLNIVAIRGRKLYCSNVGDSRAIIGNQVNDVNARTSTGKNWVAISLSRDHKPDLQDEAERIFKCGGRVLSYADENGNPAGPARVWIKDQNIPGLAMSRSIGDGIAKTVGVIADPEVLEYNLAAEDKFIVVGSDGVFEFLSNEDIVKIVVPYWKSGNASGASRAVVSAAEYRWKSEDIMVDDITAVCVFLSVD